jgi:hypothetical protein
MAVPAIGLETYYKIKTVPFLRKYTSCTIDPYFFRFFIANGTLYSFLFEHTIIN